MKPRLFVFLTAIVVFLVISFSTGNAVYMFFAIIAMVCVLYSFFSIFLSTRHAKVLHELSAHAVKRGERVDMVVSVSYNSFLPIAPITLFLRTGASEEVSTIRLTSSSKGVQYFSYQLSTNHVGTYYPGVTQYIIEDIFGFFSYRFDPDILPMELLVLPLTFEVEPLKFSPGDTGLETISRAREDATNPADIRTYQQGDPLKKVHWKLSMRSKEIMVRRFEEPDLPDILVLLDTSQPRALPNSPGHSLRYIQDTLCETAASVVSSQMQSDHPVRLPLLGTVPIEYDKNMGLPLLLEELARLPFDHVDPFYKVLLMEAGRMRKSGATAIVTSTLTSQTVDVVVRIHRMGPYVRLYLATFTPDAPELIPFISKLQQNDIDVCYVTPAI
ncbi:MAG: DUF58 domain-containing protein [Clostridiales bacterium]|nr:DUF58 domain-containing protein [Clostridiales bacterium]